MPLTQYPIAGSLRDALDTGPSAYAEVLFVPLGSHDSRVEDNNALLGAIGPIKAQDLTDPYLLDEGLWRVVISTTHKTSGWRPVFQPIQVEWDHDSATTWAEIVAGAVEPVPLSPTIPQQVDSQLDSLLPSKVADTSDPVGAALSATYGQSVNVRAYGAVGNGTTDDTTAIQAALDFAESGTPFGRTTVYVPKGTYLVSTLSVASGVRLMGEGPGVTVFKRKAATTGHLVKTKNFDTLATFTPNTPVTTPATAPRGFTFADFSIDGNKANAPSGGCGVAIVGYEYLVSNVHTNDNASHGFYTEWVGSGPNNGGTFVESHVRDVKTFRNGGNGFWHFGPHDSYNIFITSANNGLDGFLVEGNASHYAHCHAFGQHDWAWHVRGEAFLTGVVGEGAMTGQMWLEHHKSYVLGGSLYWAGDSSSIGLRMGKTGNAPAHSLLISGLNISRGPAGTSAPALTPAVEFQNVGANLRLSGAAYSDVGTPATLYTGTVPLDASIDLIGAVDYANQNLIQTPRASDPLPLPPALFDHFTAADGTALDAAKWATTNGGGAGIVADIQGNAARLLTGTGGGYSNTPRVRMASTLANTLVDVGIMFRFTHADVTKESYLNTFLRANLVDIYNGAGRKGYIVQIIQFANGTWTFTLVKRDAGVNTTLYTSGVLAATTTGTKRWVRFRAKGSTIEAKHWLDGAAEPASWTTSVTDTQITTGGYVVVEAAAGAAAVATTQLVDQVAIYAL